MVEKRDDQNKNNLTCLLTSLQFFQFFKVFYTTALQHHRIGGLHKNMSNEHHKWLKKRDWPAVDRAMTEANRDVDLLRRKYKERDKHGRLPAHWMAAKAQRHTHMF